LLFALCKNKFLSIAAMHTGAAPRCHNTNNRVRFGDQARESGESDAECLLRRRALAALSLFSGERLELAADITAI